MTNVEIYEKNEVMIKTNKNDYDIIIELIGVVILYIQDGEIRRVVPDEKEYRFGRYMDIHSLLERMTVSLDDSSGCIRVNARIADANERYIISIKISHQGEIIQTSCTCPKHRQCKHLAAILFFLKKLEVTSFPYCYELNSRESRDMRLKEIEERRQQQILSSKQQESVDLIDFYKDQLYRESLVSLSNQKHQVKALVKKEKENFDVSLKIVTPQQTYSVRNLETFFDAIDTHKNLKYGKNFEFIHSEEAFDEDSVEIIHFVKECYLRSQSQKKGIIKEVTLSDDLLDRFYDLMSDMSSQYCDIAFDKKQKNISLEIEKKDHNYVLDFRDYHEFDSTVMTRSYLYSFEDDVLYRYDFENNAKMVTFLHKLLETRGGLYIGEESLMDFYKYILVDLLEDIDLDTHLFDTYRQENMINLYVDLTSDDQICVQLEYLYDETLAYGFDEKNQNISKEADLIENYLRPYIEDQEDHMIYLEYDHDFSYQFVMEGLPYLSNYCHVFVSEALQTLTNHNALDFRVGVQMNHGLLSIDIQNIDMSKEELADILKAYKKKRKFYKLKTGKYVSLEGKELKEMSQLMENLQINLQDLSKENIELPSYRLFELNQMAQNDTELNFDKNNEFEHWIEELTASRHDYELPQQYDGILRDYQIKGYQWLRLMEHYHFGGILADDMGLGKTLQMITYLESMKGKGTHLVITPASLVLNWQDEFDKFSTSLNVIPVYGKKDYREKCIQNIEQYDVVITSYDYLRRDIELYEDKQFHTVILDEAQSIKNPKTRNAMSVKKLKAKQRFALTGTPIENSLAELWSIFDFLMPHYLYRYAYFSDKYEKPIVKDHDEDKQNELKQMITPFILRRNKKDVLTELPDKIQQTLYFRMDEEEEKLYMSQLIQMNKSLQEKYELQSLGRMEILAMLTRLRQICQDSRLLFEDRQEPSSKMKGCMELIQTLQENGKKILLFSSFTSVLHLIGEQCQKEHISYYILEGSTPKEKRKQLVDAFQNDDTTLFLISLKAGGSGLNLTSAQAVIHFDPWWNISAQNQATDRAYRMGQTETVQVFSLIMKNTIEEKIMNLQNDKKNLADAFVEGNEGAISSMSVDDMKALFNIE